MCNSIFIDGEYETSEFYLQGYLAGKRFGIQAPPPAISIHCCSYKNAYGIGELIGASTGEDYL